MRLAARPPPASVAPAAASDNDNTDVPVLSLVSVFNSIDDGESDVVADIDDDTSADR